VASTLGLFNSLVNIDFELSFEKPSPLEDFADLDEESEMANHWGSVCPSLRMITLPISMHLVLSQCWVILNCAPPVAGTTWCCAHPTHFHFNPRDIGDKDNGKTRWVLKAFASGKMPIPMIGGIPFGHNGDRLEHESNCDDGHGEIGNDDEEQRYSDENEEPMYG